MTGWGEVAAPGAATSPARNVPPGGWRIWKDMAKRILISAALALLGAGAAAGQPAPFNTYLLPAISTIGVGDTAYVRFEVDETAREFNGYEIDIQYDPDIVEFLPPVIEGQLMIEACPTPRWKVLTQTDSTLTFSHVIMCAGVALNGPGVLSIYRFRGLAEGASPITLISDPDDCFYYAGTTINPNHPTFPRQVIFHNAEIHVGPQSGIDSGAAPPLEFRLEQNVPNPFSFATAIGFELAAAGPVALEVFDVAGRRVWADAAQLPPGAHRLTWRGTTPDAAPLPSGIYFYRLTTAQGVASRKLTISR